MKNLLSVFKKPDGWSKMTFDTKRSYAYQDLMHEYIVYCFKVALVISVTFILLIILVDPFFDKSILGIILFVLLFVFSLVTMIYFTNRRMKLLNKQYEKYFTTIEGKD